MHREHAKTWLGVVSLLFAFVAHVSAAGIYHGFERSNPDLDLETVDRRLDATNIQQAFRHCSIIVEALDRAEDKKMMADAFMADSRLLVSASGIGGWGNSDRIRTVRVRDTFCLVGDGESEVSESMPPTSAVVGLAAAKQADIVIENFAGGVTGRVVSGEEALRLGLVTRVEEDPLAAAPTVRTRPRANC